jgi:hypothetical protein
VSTAYAIGLAWSIFVVVWCVIWGGYTTYYFARERRPLTITRGTLTLVALATYGIGLFLGARLGVFCAINLYR